MCPCSALPIDLETFNPTSLCWKGNRSGVKLHFVRSVVEVESKPRFSAKEVHTSRSADEAEKKGIPSVALQVHALPDDMGE